MRKVVGFCPTSTTLQAAFFELSSIRVRLTCNLTSEKVRLLYTRLYGILVDSLVLVLSSSFASVHELSCIYKISYSEDGVTYTCLSCLHAQYIHMPLNFVHSNGVYSSFRAKASGGQSKARETRDAQFLQKCTRFALIAVTSTRLRVCKCPPTSDACQSVAILMNRRHFCNYGCSLK